MIDRLRRLLIKRGPESDPRPARSRRRPQIVVLQGGARRSRLRPSAAERTQRQGGMTRELGQSMSKASELERNPFRPGMGLEPPYLADRQYQLHRFARYLNGFPEFPRNVRVVGLRGVGKTVLLQRYAALAEESEWVVVRRELGTDLQDEAAFGLAVVDDCRVALDRVSRRAAQRDTQKPLSRTPSTCSVASALRWPAFL